MLDVASRLREVRVEQFGEHGGPALAEILDVPARTWVNYESGVSIPGLILLRFLTATGTEPEWLLHGRGPRRRSERKDRGADLLLGGLGPFRRQFGEN
jgi:hypothetical protein